jgi:hypothetical protein
MVEVFTVRVGVMFLAVPPFELSVEIRMHMGGGFVMEDHIDGDEEVEELGPVATIVKFVGPVEGLLLGVVQDGPDEGRLHTVLEVQVAGEYGGHGLCGDLGDESYTHVGGINFVGRGILCRDTIYAFEGRWYDPTYL